MHHRQLVVIAFSLLALAFSIPVFAGKTISGKLNGHHCAHEGMTCAIDKLDPHITLEEDFVLMVKDGYYFLPNLPRDTKVRYVLENVTVKGDVDLLDTPLSLRSLVFQVWTAESFTDGLPRATGHPALLGQSVQAVHQRRTGIDVTSLPAGERPGPDLAVARSASQSAGWSASKLKLPTRSWVLPSGPVTVTVRLPPSSVRS